jgi:BA14K-like protein
MKCVTWSFAAAALLAAHATALADAQGYCADYARDMASNRLSGSAILTGERTPVSPEQWAAANAEIFADCLDTFAPATAETATPLKPKRKKVVAAASVPPSQDDDLKPGSKAWKDYCARKYVSFDAKTGLYTGQSGKQRPCLVTRD